MKKLMLVVVSTVLAAQGCTYYVSSDGHSHATHEGIHGADNYSGNQGVNGVSAQVLKNQVTAAAYMSRSTAVPVQGAENPLSHKVAETAPMPESDMIPPATGLEPEETAEEGFTRNYWAGFFKEGTLILLRAWAGTS